MKKYMEDLPEKERDKSFISICQKHGQVVTADSMNTTLNDIKEKCSQRSKRKQKALTAFESVVRGLRDYVGIINTFSMFNIRQFLHPFLQLVTSSLQRQPIPFMRLQYGVSLT